MTAAGPVATATRDEIERFAQAILAGETARPRPGALAKAPLRIEWRAPSEPAGYRADASASGTLRIVGRYATWRAVLLWLYSLLASAAIASVWVDRWKAGISLWLAAPSALVGYVSLRRTLALFDRFTITVADGALRYQSSYFWWKRRVALPIASIAQLYVVERQGAFQVDARLHDGTTAAVITNLAHPEHAVYFERQLELALRVLDAPVAGELPKHRPLPAGSARRALFVQLGVISAITLAVFVGFRAAGVPLASVSVAERPTEARFSVDRASRVFFTTEVRLEDPIATQFDDVPRSAQYEITILRGDAVVATLRCDPLDSFVWSSTDVNRHLRSFEASLHACSADLPAAGAYTLRARRSWRAGLPRVAMDSSLTIREEL